MAADPTSTPSDQLDRAVRQSLETDRLLGVDFVPVGRPATAQGRGPTAPGDEKAMALHELHQRHDATCPHCTSVATHVNTVFGEGDPDADLMFIGEAPGAEEDRTGRPFVGRAGKKLDEMIQAIGLEREAVYIANVLKSRPPDNRTPLQHEVDRCSPFLAEQIQIIQPRVIMTLGGPATKLMLGTTQGITRLRGQWSVFEDDQHTVPVMPTFHPAYMLRNYTRDTREKVWADLKAVAQRLGM
jgi:DNA polymerase